ncbi:hypothetical protein O7553_24215 [Solwaraspora sp. WMMA2059]|uniref:hypothetical protein n=1 Tax=Solwaraspora sp. WMMA2059 TaxID=3015160 RepID=UPI00248C08EF|nr:hypothetical protein [Solwaraspora sp. WMMA2059]WBB96388.1 hypothetical protein O7553_24215 [Solwaraspora sp. WMMA2059]
MTGATSTQERVDGPADRPDEPPPAGSGGPSGDRLRQPPRDRLRWPARIALAVTLAVGAAGQIAVWAAGNWLWNDETAIAINLRRTFLELTRGMEFQQVAPVGWLWLEKTLWLAFGDGERVLRLPSLAGMLAVLVLTAIITRRVVGRWAAVAATALIAAAPMILTYVGELKQYAVESAVALAVLLLGDRYLASVGHRRGRSRWLLPVGWAAATLVAVFVSLTAVLVLAAAVAGMTLLLALRRRWTDVAVLLAGSAPAVAFAGYLIDRRRRFPFMPGQSDYFADGTPPAGSGPVDILAWLPRMWSSFVTVTLDWRQPLLVLLLAVAGVAVLIWRRRSLWAAMLGGTLLVAVAAAAARGLPLADRVATWLIAPTVILVVAGLDGGVRLALHAGTRLTSRVGTGLTSRVGTGARRAGRVAVASVVLMLAVAVLPVIAHPAAVAAYRQVVDPQMKDAGPAALADVAARAQPGDLVLFYWFSYRMVVWYGPRHDLAPHTVRLYPSDHGKCDPQAFGEWLGDVDRVWYVHGRSLSSAPDDYPTRVAAEFADYGTIVEIRDFPADRWSTAAWALVDLTAGPDPQPPVVEPDPEHACLGRW